MKQETQLSYNAPLAQLPKRDFAVHLNAIVASFMDKIKKISIKWRRAFMTENPVRPAPLRVATEASEVPETAESTEFLESLESRFFAWLKHLAIYISAVAVACATGLYFLWQIPLLQELPQLLKSIASDAPGVKSTPTTASSQSTTQPTTVFSIQQPPPGEPATTAPDVPAASAPSATPAVASQPNPVVPSQPVATETAQTTTPSVTGQVTPVAPTSSAAPASSTPPPSIPSAVATQAVPVTPATPGTPGTPGTAQATATPATPGTPGTPGTAQATATPIPPTTLATAAAGQIPPATPTSPTAPEANQANSAASPTATPANGATPPVSQAEIGQLLADAQQQMQNRRFVSPTSGNALHTYQRVLELEPTNSVALDGIQRIGAYYRDMAAHSLQQGRTEESLSNISRGLRATPQDEALLSLRREARSAKLREEARQRAEAQRKALVEAKQRQQEAEQMAQQMGMEPSLQPQSPPQPQATPPLIRRRPQQQPSAPQTWWRPAQQPQPPPAYESGFNQR